MTAMTAISEGTDTPPTFQAGQVMAVLVPVEQWNSLLRQLEALQQRVATLETFAAQQLGYIPGNREAALAQLEAWRHEPISEAEQTQHREELQRLLAALEGNHLTI